MKYGQSLLLGELITADQVDYEDVRKNRFWIVCPVCNEAIFKVVRQNRDSGVVEDPHSHYFSHYEASRSYVTDCELRVGRITEDDFHTIAVTSREQKLKYFIATLQAAIHQHFLVESNGFWDRAGRSAIQRFGDGHFRQLRRSHTLALYRDIHYRFFQKVQRMLSDEEMLAELELSIQSVGEEEKTQLTTNLSISTQKRIALDLLKHLTGPKARPTFNFLFDHAYTWLTIRLKTNIYIDRVTGIEKDLLQVLNRLPNTNRRKFPQLLVDLKQIDHSHLIGRRHDALDTFGLMLRDQMLLILVSLPYLDILRESLPQPQRRNGDLKIHAVSY
jgi:hypothetical protein